MNLSSQIAELAIAYALAAAGMLAALLLSRADGRAYWRLPVYAAMAMALGVILWNMVRRHLDLEWIAAHHDLMYAFALALYAALGFALGLLLGRMTRRRPPSDDPGSRM